jgi:hypothetical protein
MKRFAISAAIVGFAVASASAQVKINEVMATGVGTDSKEFVELYGAGNLDLSPYKLELVNGSNGLVYQSYDLQGETIPADGYFVMSGSTTLPNVDMTTGTATNWIQNGDPDAIVIRRKSDSAVIDAVSYYTQYDTSPGSPEYVSLPADTYEGNGAGVGGDDSFNFQTGTAASTAQGETSFGRFPDGADSDNNVIDFVNLHAGQSPGAPNVSTYDLTLPFSEDFGAGGLTRKWGRFFTDVVLETVGGTPIPASVPNSPDSVTPASFASMKDNTGGGDENGIIDFIGQDYYVEGQFYVGPLSTVSDGTEVGALMGRRTVFQNNITGNAYPISTPAGTYGDSFYALEADYVSGVISAVKVEKSVRTVVYTHPAIGSASWHKLALNMNGSTVEYQIDGATVFTLTGETPHYGIVSIGYRETSTGSTGQVRNNFDALKVEAAHVVSAVNDWKIY